MLQTGDKSGEVTARMNLSDLRVVVSLKSNSNIYPPAVGFKSSSNIYPNIFRNTNSSALAPAFQGYPNLAGKSAILRKASRI